MISTLALLNPTGFVSSSGYAAIFILSVLQSCCVPTSSELTLGFGGVLASEGALSLPGVILAGAAGEVVGGYIAWAIGRAGGRPLVERYGRYVLVSGRDLDRAEAWYGRHEHWGVLGSRLLPVIRNFVAVPAGIARVPALRFGILTALGSLIWDGAMALIGYGIGGQWRTVMKGFSDAGYLLGALVVIAIAVLIWHRWRSYRAAEGTGRGSHWESLERLGDRVSSDTTAYRSQNVHPAGPKRGLSESSPQRLHPPDGQLPVIGRFFPSPVAAKVPEIIALFWAVKILTTAGGEATSDYLKNWGNIAGGGAELVLFAVGLLWQFGTRRYRAAAYWFLAYAIATIGCGVADFLHLDVHIPYAGTTVLWAVILAAIFWTWQRSEGTLSIHSITTQRREGFYWATVFATFALGTALGDFTAIALHMGYLASGIFFGVVILIPALAWRHFGLSSIAAFWMSYIVTRPLGASFADYISKPRNTSGIGFGDGRTAIVFAIAILLLVGYLAAVRPDIQTPPNGLTGRPRPRPTRQRPQITSRPQVNLE